MTSSGKETIGKSGKETAVAAATSGGKHPILTLREEVDRLFDDFFRGWPSRLFPSRLSTIEPFGLVGELMPVNTLMPKVDVSETKDGFEIEAELPGVDEKDIAVSLKDGVLIITGEKKAEREEKKKDYYLSERSYGSVRRAFELPDSVEEDKISAKFEKGVLSITLPKSKEAKTAEKRISIASK
ncbi:MAG TPA: Hsp20/alpha crystallin family protein [Alphaproteobacteria bacterium]|nr:Hsp20/alpha crystallin family protein [Alphaproteobacteria bacterium]